MTGPDLPRRRARHSSRGLVFALFLLALVGSLPPTVARTFLRLGRTVGYLGEDARGARLRVLGADTVAALDALRAAIPADGAYFLVDGSEESQAATLWVRFELAPRRAIFLGRWTETEGAALPTKDLPPGPDWVVLATSGKAPRLLSRQELVALSGNSRGRG